jgi:CubicO group peptidase (beta-lactamase class C family)
MTVERFQQIGTREFTDWLAAQAPTYDGEERTEYHGLTRGLYTDAIVRQLTNQSLREFVQANILDVLNEDRAEHDKLEFYLGNVPEQAEKDRVSTHHGVGLL